MKLDNNDYLLTVPERKPQETASNGSDVPYEETFGAYNISSKESQRTPARKSPKRKNWEKKPLDRDEQALLLEESRQLEEKSKRVQLLNRVKNTSSVRKSRNSYEAGNDHDSRRSAQELDLAAQAESDNLLIESINKKIGLL